MTNRWPCRPTRNTYIAHQPATWRGAGQMSGMTIGKDRTPVRRRLTGSVVLRLPNRTRRAVVGLSDRISQPRKFSLHNRHGNCSILAVNRVHYAADGSDHVAMSLYHAKGIQAISAILMNRLVPPMGRNCGQHPAISGELSTNPVGFAFLQDCSKRRSELTKSDLGFKDAGLSVEVRLEKSHGDRLHDRQGSPPG